MVKSASLSDRIDYSDIRVSKFNGLSKAINHFNHHCNPLHLVYCKLKNIGLTKSTSLFCSCLYEKIIYNPLDKCLEWISKLTYKKADRRMRGLENL